MGQIDEVGKCSDSDSRVRDVEDSGAVAKVI
jgi:hypothetical protein